jgi:Tol biopolymer transport system component
MKINVSLITAVRMAALSMVVSLSASTPPELASKPPTNLPFSTTANGHSGAPDLSADGRFLVFVSDANNLVTNDANGTVDVFIRDRQLKRTLLISINGDGSQSANGTSCCPMVSTNGQWVVFQSNASDLVANDNNGQADIFVRDQSTGETRLVSVAMDASGSGNGPSTNPQMTPDGRFVLYESQASNLASDDTNQAIDVFLYDRFTGSNSWVSAPVRSSGVSAILDSYGAQVTPDRRFVVFQSWSSDLVDFADTNRTSDIFVRDLEKWTNILVSINHSSDGSGNGSSDQTGISANGRYVVFRSTASNLSANAGSPGGIFLRDVQQAETILVSLAPGSATEALSYCGRPVINDNGRYIGFMATNQIYVWDRQLGTTTLVTHQPGTSQPCSMASSLTGSELRGFSPDGQWLVFCSGATNLVAGADTGEYQIYRYHLATGTNQWLKANRQDTSGGWNDDPSLSADGQWLAFASEDSNLTDNDRNAASDVFVMDLSNGQVELISERQSLLIPQTGEGSSTLSKHALSANGRILVYASASLDMAAEKPSWEQDVLVRDLQTGMTELVSRDSDTSANINTQEPCLSADGRFLAFSSGTNVYVRNLATGSNVVVSMHYSGTSPANGISRTPLLSYDSQTLVFRSTAGDLTKKILSGNRYQLYGRDLVNQTNWLISTDSFGNPLFRECDSAFLASQVPRLVFTVSPPDDNQHIYVHEIDKRTTRALTNSGSVLFLSADGQWLAYQHIGSPTQRAVIVYDLASSNIVYQTENGLARNPSLSADGRWLCFEMQRGGIYQTFVRDLIKGEANVLVSGNCLGTGGGNRDTRSSRVTADGRYVLFLSTASDLVANDTNDATDVFVRDRANDNLILISANQARNGTGNRLSGNPVISADGRTVVFASFASDMTAGDWNNAIDLFVVRLGYGDSDGDGMNDDWELTYFGNLSRDGNEDTDGDGVSDLDEFSAGTSPLGNSSYLSLITVIPLNGGPTTIYWNAVPGRAYRAQYKNDVNTTVWTDLPGDIVAEDHSASKLDDTGAGLSQRFYRVVLVDR